MDATVRVAAEARLGGGVALLDDAVAQAPFAALLFSADDALTLLWRNRAHEVMSQSVGVEVAGRGMFEAFPPSEDAEGAAAMQAIRGAVATMLETRAPTDIGPYRYDLRSADGAFVEYHWQMRMSPVVREERVAAILQVAQDVTREVLDRRLSDALRRTAASTAAVSYFSFDPETDAFARTAAVDEMFGFAPDEAGDRAAPFFARVHPDDLQGVHDEVARVFAAPRGEVAAFDYRVPHADGSERFLRIRAEVAVDPADRREKLVGTFVDLTDVEADRRQLKRELVLREALVKEANHRIKNSLAIAVAMLRLEKQSILAASPEDTRSAMSALTALEARIDAISGAHGLMQLEGNRTDVSLHGLLKALASQMRATASVTEDDIRLTLSGPDAMLDSGMATSLGMILSELMTNALKYGLDQRGRSDIAVACETSDEGATVVVRNRIERERPLDSIASTRLGSLLVQQLASDFGAVVESEEDRRVYVSRVHLPRQAPVEA